MRTLDANSEPASTLYFDEAGDPTLFAKGGKVVAGTVGCSRFFMLGKLEVMDAAALEQDLASLRANILADPYFRGVPSFDPARNKTAIAFHAKNDLPEVRHEVFKVLLRHELRFYAVVRDKLRLLDYVQQRNHIEPAYRYDPTGNELYDELTRELFGRVHRLGHTAKVIFAQRGTKPRLQAFRDAIQHADNAFTNDFDLKRSSITGVEASQPKYYAGLQAADYFLWALQRFYERGEERYVQLIWPQTTMVCDLDAAPLEPARKGDTKRGVTYNETRPLGLATRAGVVNRVVEDIG